MLHRIRVLVGYFIKSPISHEVFLRALIIWLIILPGRSLAHINFASIVDDGLISIFDEMGISTAVLLLADLPGKWFREPPSLHVRLAGQNEYFDFAIARGGSKF